MLWFIKYKDLIWNLTISDLKIKYQSSVLGFTWSLLNPLLMMLVLYAVFSNIFQMNQENFALYILVGLLTWRFLANGTTSAISSITGRSSLVTKVYIPRQILVLSTVLSCFISSVLEFLILIALLIIVGISLTPYILFFPVAHAIFFFIVYGMSLILASLYVYYRDLNQIWQVLIQLGFFLSPIAYPLSAIPSKYFSLYLLNPVTLLMDMYRNFLIYGMAPALLNTAYLMFVAIILMIAGVVIFKKLERRFAEEI